jgi:FkbM family methyltransferase
MLRFSDIPVDSFLGKTSRMCLSIIPKDWAVPVLQGPLKGLRWIVGAQTHGMWLGSYEAEKQIAISKVLRPGQTFYDIGANAGFFTLLGARCAGASGRVVAVEPLPRNIEMIERHLSINGISNACVVGKAISDFVGTARFAVEGHSTSRLSREGQVPVEVTTLDALVEELGIPPNLIKVDIEGAEIKLLRGAKKVLQEFRPVVFMAVHSKEIFDELMKVAPALEYEVKELDGTDVRTGRFRDEIVLMPVESNPIRKLSAITLVSKRGH